MIDNGEEMRKNRRAAYWALIIIIIMGMLTFLPFLAGVFAEWWI